MIVDWWTRLKIKDTIDSTIFTCRHPLALISLITFKISKRAISFRIYSLIIQMSLLLYWLTQSFVSQLLSSLRVMNTFNSFVLGSHYTWLLKPLNWKGSFDLCPRFSTVPATLIFGCSVPILKGSITVVRSILFPSLSFVCVFLSRQSVRLAWPQTTPTSRASSNWRKGKIYLNRKPLNRNKS